MPTDAKPEQETKVRTSVQLEPDERAWVAARALELRVSEAWVVRQAIRAQMQASEQAS
jgi:hypothetical protein